MQVKTKVIIGFFLGLAIIGSCGKSDKKSPAVTTTTTANQVQTTITNPTTTTTLEPVSTTTQSYIAPKPAEVIAPKATTTTLPKTTTTTTTVAPVTTTTTAVVSSSSFKTPGSYCSPEGATGVSKTGVALTCTMKDGEVRARWRS